MIAPASGEKVSGQQPVLSQHLSSLQYLRAIAALLVVYFHAVIQVRHLAGTSLFPMIGACGVDIFFVVSGFVMWTTTSRSNEPTVSEFMAKRLIRIAPLYWIVTIAAGAIAFVAPSALRSTQFEPAHFLASLAFVPWKNPMVGWGHPEVLTPLIVPGWTLNMEMMFYLVFAVGLAVPRRRRLMFVATVLTVIYLVCRSFAEQQNIFRFYGSDMLFEFLAGIVIAKLYADRRLVSRRHGLMLLAAGLFAILLLDLVRFDLPRIIRAGLAASLIVYGAVSAERPSRAFWNRAFQQLGDASYSIYLTHIFVISAMRIALGAVDIRLSVWSGVGFVLAALILSAGVGWQIYVHLERPLTIVINRALRGRRPAPGTAEFGRT